MLNQLGLGLGVAFTAPNLLSAFAGALLGTLAGVLPGLGAVATIALLLPLAHGLGAVPALILLAGVYCGAQHGGSIGAIFGGAAGDASLLATPLDGRALARQGRAGQALVLAALGALFAGFAGAGLIAVVAPALIELASHFGPAEYFSLIVLGLIGAVVLASGALLKAIAMIILGLLLAQANVDALVGPTHFAFDLPELADGIGFIALAIGVFGLGEIIAHLGRQAAPSEEVASAAIGPLPTRADAVAVWPAVLRGTALGALIGVLPGGGALLASFAAYAVEKRARARAHEAPFGRGNLRGVAGPEAANSAGARTALIPLLALGIPTNAAMALLAGATLMQGIEPGAQVTTSHAPLFWGLIASLGVGNLMLLMLNLPLLRVWVRLLGVPYRFVFPALVLFACIGVYLLHHNRIDLYLVALFAALGYAFHKLSCDPAPLLLGFVLWQPLEENLRHALQLASGDWSTFVTRPLSAGLLSVAALLIVVVLLPSVGKRRDAAFLED